MKKVFMTIFAAALAMSMSAVTPHFGVEFGYDHGSMRVVEENVPQENLKDLKDMYKMDGFHVGGNVQLDFLDGKHIPSLVIGANYQFLRNDLTQTDKEIKKEKQTYMDEAKKESGISSPIFNYDITMHTIQVPVRAQYAYQINDAFRVFAYTGPQLRFHVSMQQSQEISAKYEGKKTGEGSMLDEITGREKTIGWLNGERYGEEIIPNYSKGTAKIITIADGKKDVVEEKIDKNAKDNLGQWFDMSWGFGVGFAWNNLSLNISYDLGMMNITSTKAQKRAKENNMKYVVNSDALAVTLGYRF